VEFKFERISFGIVEYFRELSHLSIYVNRLILGKGKFVSEPYRNWYRRGANPRPTVTKSGTDSKGDHGLGGKGRE